MTDAVDPFVARNQHVALHTPVNLPACESGLVQLVPRDQSFLSARELGESALI